MEVLSEFIVNVCWGVPSPPASHSANAANIVTKREEFAYGNNPKLQQIFKLAFLTELKAAFGKLVFEAAQCRQVFDWDLSPCSRVQLLSPRLTDGDLWLAVCLCVCSRPCSAHPPLLPNSLCHDEPPWDEWFSDQPWSLCRPSHLSSDECGRCCCLRTLAHGMYVNKRL